MGSPEGLRWDGCTVACRVGFEKGKKEKKQEKGDREEERKKERKGEPKRRKQVRRQGVSRKGWDDWGREEEEEEKLFWWGEGLLRCEPYWIEGWRDVGMDGCVFKSMRIYRDESEIYAA